MAVGGQDIGLLFGVLGGGRIGGESGALIKSQLDSIVASLNNETNSKGRRIKFNLDVAGTKQSFTRGLRQVMDSLSGQKQFKIKVSQIDATSAINKLRADLDTMLRTLKVDTGFTVTMGSNGATSAVKQVAADAKDAVLSINEAEAALKEISLTNQSLNKGYINAKNLLGGEAATGDNIAALEQLKSEYLKLQTVTSELSAKKTSLTQKELNGLYATQSALQSLINTTMERVAAENAAAEATRNRSAAATAAAEKEKAAETDVAAMRKDAIALQKRMNSALTNFSKASGTQWYQTIVSGKAEIDAMLSGVASLDRVKLNGLIDSFNACEGAIRGSGLATKSFGDIIVANAKKFTSWFGTSQIIMRVIRVLRDMVTAVKEVDVAMTELKKVTNETDVTYTRFLEDARKRANALGATLSDTINATADFARLGYTLKESATLADAAIVYKNVGDGISSIDDASASVISTMKAFNIEAEKSMFIVDKFNEIGNNFPISSKGVGDALLRSASALAAGNNTLDESIGLITAANSVVQDADKVGTALKTVSMFLRAAKTEAEDAGESTEGMANSVSELREELLSLTGGKVDIQIDENTFKSTYQIMEELSEVWGELTDVSQANILEMIGGKRNSNVVSALLSNFQIAQDVITTSADAAGSALAENEKYLDSIAGRISVFKSSFESLSQNFFESEVVKGVVTFGTALVSVANGLAKIDVLLPSIIAAAVTYKSLKMAKSVAQLTIQEEAAVASLVQRLVVEKATNDSLVVSYQTLSAAQQKDVLSKLQAIAGTKALSQETYELIASNLTLATSTSGVAAATDKLNVSFKSLLTSNPYGWILLAVSLIPSAINLVNSFVKSNEELIQEADELKEAYSNSLSEVADNLSTLRGIENEFYQLSKGVDDYGNNISLAADDYERYREIVNTVLGISPSLIAGYDAEGNAIANKNDLLKKSISLMEEEQRLKMKEYVSDKNLETIGLGAAAEIRELKINNPVPYGDAKINFMNAFAAAANRYASEEQGNYEGQIYDALNPGNIDLDSFFTEGYWSQYGDDADRFAQEYYEEIVNALRSNRSILENYFTQLEIDNLLSLSDSYDASIAPYERQLEELTKKLNPTLQYVPQSITAYSELTDKQKEFLTNYINQFRITADTTEKDIAKMKQDILDLTYLISENAEIGNIINLGVSLIYGSDKDLTVAEYNARMAELWESIQAIEDEDIKIKLKLAFGFDDDGNIDTPVSDMIAHTKGLLQDGLDHMVDDMTISELQIYYNISANANSLTIEELEEKAKEWKKATGLEGLKNALSLSVDDLKAAEEIISKIASGDVNAESFSKLLEIVPSARFALEEYYEAMSAATSENDELAAQATLYKKLGSAIRAIKAEKVADGLKEVAEAATMFGADSYQAVSAVLALRDYSPELVSALYDEETGLLKVGEAAEYTAASLLAIARIDLTNSIVETTNQINTLRTALNTSTAAAGGFINYRAINQEISSLEGELSGYEDLMAMYDDVFSISVGSGGGGGSTPADKIKEAFDTLNSSIEHNIFLQGQYYEEAEKSLDGDAMRTALFKQIEYYEQIQNEAHKAAEELRNYYRKQGLSAEQIELQSDIQELSKVWWDAADSIEDANRAIREDIVKSFSDAVDEIQDVHKTLHAAADEYAKSGYITVDVLQSIVDMGVEYLAFLQDENGQLVINEEGINNIIKARTEQMAVESALAYVEALRLAKSQENIEELNRLLYATTETTGATWGLVYANLGLLGLSDDQYNAALNNINALRSLANSAVQSVGRVVENTSDKLKDMQRGVDDILKYVMDMIRHNVEEQIDDLEKLKTAYADLIELKKESLQATKDETDYQDEVASKIKEIAKLQERINLLSLDDSRDAESQKAKLMEEMAELQKELADTQAEHALDTQLESLDKMQEAYEKQKDDEINVLEDTISSEQKLYDMAIDYIQDNWDTLYDTLIDWNYEYGNALSSEISSAWDSCLAAARRYGDYVSALNQLPSDIEAAGSSGTSSIVGDSYNDTASGNDSAIRSIVATMERNANSWHSASSSQRKTLEAENERLAEQLRKLGLSVRKSNGVWYLQDGRELFDVYTYHTGGIVGDGGSLKENELLAKLERGEVMISNNTKSTLFSLIEFVDLLSRKLDVASTGVSRRPFANDAAPDLSNITTNQNETIHFGDVYIYGADDQTVEKHREVTRRFTNEVLKQLNIKP